MTVAPAYLDHAASTPVRAEARDAMLPYLGALAGNPSSAHAAGRAARVGLERARRQVAEALGAEPSQVFFTSGGTEADNLAVLGAVLARTPAGHAAVSAVEHKAVLAAAHAGVRFGGRETLLPVDGDGAVALAALDAALATRPAVVSVMWANNETGVLQPVPALAERCRAARVPFHTDAVQAVGRVPVSFRDVDLLTVSGHKLGAPKGIGALLVREPAVLSPLVHGGSQQHALRPGTENLAGAVALGVAVELAVREQAGEAARLAALRDELEGRLLAAVPGTRIAGAGAPRVPHVCGIMVPGTDTGTLLLHLDALGVCASGGSACATGSPEPSHVLGAMGVPRELALGFVRLSLGRASTADDARRAAEAFPVAVARARQVAEALHG